MVGHMMLANSNDYSIYTYNYIYTHMFSATVGEQRGSSHGSGICVFIIFAQIRMWGYNWPKKCTYMHPSIRPSIHPSIQHTHTHTYIYIYAYVHIYIYISLSLPLSLSLSGSLYRYIYSHICINDHKCKCLHIHTHNIYTYIHAHIIHAHVNHLKNRMFEGSCQQKKDV